MRNWATLAGAVFGFLGVALGAFGAHALEDLLASNGRVATWDTATQYHLFHALLLLVIGFFQSQRDSRWIRTAAIAATVGILIFAGSLYLLCITNVAWLGAITPIGGLGFLLAWAALFFHHLSPNKSNS